MKTLITAVILTAIAAPAAAQTKLKLSEICNMPAYNGHVVTVESDGSIFIGSQKQAFKCKVRTIRAKFGGGSGVGHTSKQKTGTPSDRVVGQTDTRPQGLGGPVEATATGNGTGGGISEPNGDVVVQKDEVKGGSGVGNASVPETATQEAGKTEADNPAPDSVGPTEAADAKAEPETVSGLSAG